jgi:glutamine synthetase
LPNSITKAASTLEADTRFGEILTADFGRHWVETRRWEWKMFNTTGGDPDAPTGAWERDRYFEWV